MIRTVEGAGVPLAVTADRGEGRATVLVHGMGGTEWPLDRLPGRVIAYDRRGYGGSGAPEPYTGTTVNEHAEDLAAVVRSVDAAPALLVGKGFGALVVLDVLLRHPRLIRGAVLIDPPVYMFVAQATEALSEDRAALEAELRAATPEELAVARPRIIDFGALATLPLTHAALGSISVPVAVVSSEGARPHDIAAAEALLERTPSAMAAVGLIEGLRAVMDFA